MIRLESIGAVSTLHSCSRLSCSDSALGCESCRWQSLNHSVILDSSFDWSLNQPVSPWGKEANRTDRKSKHEQQSGGERSDRNAAVSWTAGVSCVSFTLHLTCSSSTSPASLHQTRFTSRAACVAGVIYCLLVYINMSAWDTILTWTWNDPPVAAVDGQNQSLCSLCLW